MSAGAGGAGSFQSRTSTDTITHKLTIRQWIWQVSHTGGGSAEKGNSKNRSRWAVISLPVRQYKKPHKEAQRISILKDLSSLRYSRGRQWGKKFSGILQLVSPIKNLPFVIQKKRRHLFKNSREGLKVWTDVPQRESRRLEKTDRWEEEKGDGERLGAGVKGERLGCGPVKDAMRCQRLTGLQRAAVDGKLHDAADKVVGGDLTAPMKDGFYWPDASHREPVRLHIEDPTNTHTDRWTGVHKDLKWITTERDIWAETQTLKNAFKYSKHTHRHAHFHKLTQKNNVGQRVSQQYGPQTLAK